MRFASLGSGSEGNGLLVEVGTTCLLLDCGFGLKDAIQRLEYHGKSPESLTGILVTHEHDDHAGGVFRLANRYRIPVWLTHGTYSMVQRRMPANPAFKCNIIDSHEAFSIDAIEVQPYPVPHDAREPVQFTFSDGAKKLGVLTDTGTSTPHIVETLNCCDALILECNHDLQMLMEGPYPRALKSRVNSRLGHLDNDTAGKLLADLDKSRLQHVIAAHLSKTNNKPELAKAALCHALGCAGDWVGIAEQDNGLAWRDIR